MLHVRPYDIEFVGESVTLATTLRPEAMLTNRIGFPLHTQFVTCELLPFAVEECDELIQKKLQWTGIRFSQSEIDKLIRESKGHPADLQRLAAELFKEKITQARVGGTQTFYTGGSRRK